MIATPDIKHGSNDGQCFKLLALENTLQRQVEQIVAVWVLFPFENGKIWFDRGWVGEQHRETTTKCPQGHEPNTQILPCVVKLRLVVVLIENRLDGARTCTPWRDRDAATRSRRWRPRPSSLWSSAHCATSGHRGRTQQVEHERDRTAWWAMPPCRQARCVNFVQPGCQ